MKRAYIVHGWSGSPQDAWLPWLKMELEKQGFLVTVPQMPEPDEPTITAWVSQLTKSVGSPTSQDVFIGHSIGVQTILRYLMQIQSPVQGVVSVAGWFKLTLESLEEGEEEIAHPWHSTPIDVERVKRNTKKIIAVFSTDDPYVGQENVELFQAQLGAEIILLQGRQHIGGDEGITEVPELLDAIARVVKTE